MRHRCVSSNEDTRHFKVLSLPGRGSLGRRSDLPITTMLKKRSLLFTLAIGVFSLSAHAAPPNVVMIISDDHHWGDYGFMGHPQIQTPHLDKLAKQSLTFPPRLRAVQPVLPEPRLHHHRALPARTPHHQQRSAQARRRAAEGVPPIQGVQGRPRADGQAPQRMAHAAETPRAGGLCEPADRQVVARRLHDRRLHPRHDQGRPPRR